MVVKGGKSEVTGVSQSSMANRSTNPMMSSQMSTASSVAPTPSTSAFFDSPPPAPPTAPASFDLPPPPPPSSEEFNSFSPPPPPDDYPSFEAPPSPPPRAYSKENTGSSNEVYGYSFVLFISLIITEFLPLQPENTLQVILLLLQVTKDPTILLFLPLLLHLQVQNSMK